MGRQAGRCIAYWAACSHLRVPLPEGAWIAPDASAVEPDLTLAGHGRKFPSSAISALAKSS